MSVWWPEFLVLLVNQVSGYKSAGPTGSQGPQTGPKIGVAIFGPLEKWGPILRPDLRPDLGPHFEIKCGSQIWAKFGAQSFAPKFGTQIWDPKLDPICGPAPRSPRSTGIWGARPWALSPKFGSNLGPPKWDPHFGPTAWVQNWSHIWDPN